MILEMAVLGGAIYAGSRLYEKGKNHRWFRKIRDTLSRSEEPSENQTNQEVVAQSEIQSVSNKFTAASVFFGLTSIGGILGLPILTLISIPGLVYFVGLFVYTAFRQLTREQRAGMAVIDAVVTSALLFLGYFWAISLYMFFFYFSRKTLVSTRKSYHESLSAIIGDIPRFVWIKKDGAEAEIPISSVRAGDIVVVHAGETIPVDGTVSSGIASVDQHILTGESRPVEKNIGDPVFATTLVLTGTVHIRVEQAGTETVAARIKDVLRHTAAYTSSIELQGEAVGDQNALPMLVLGAVTIPLLGPMSALTIVCSYVGYSMRITGPLSVLNFLKIASRQRILIKDGRALETLTRVDTVIFDKTGTLTQEKLYVTNVHALGDWDPDDVLRYGAAAEYKQTHPIAGAVLHEVRIRGLEIPSIDDACYEIGYGLRVRADQKVIHVGSERFMRSQGIELPPKMREILAQRQEYDVYSFVYVAIDKTLAGAIELRTAVRKEARHILTSLKKKGLTVIIVSGDHEKPTRRLARDMGVERYVAEAMPEEKADLITRLRDRGKTVCFVGDGINDSIALKKANVSISLRGASTIATDTAQIILPDDGLNQLLPLFDLAESLDKNMEVNLFSSIIPGVLTIGGAYLANFGIVAAYILYYSGFAVGMTNAMIPLIQYDDKS